MYRKFFKRVIDIFGASLTLIVLAIPMLIIAIVVKCDSKGPAIFKTERVGKDKKPFMFYKFRSMTTDAPKDCATRLLDSGKYITKVGAFLRKTSLDELPQLFCILKGDMSLIGPRPVVVTETELMEMRERCGANSVRPGLTGLAQVNGRDILTDEAKAKYDGEYVKNITFWGDVKIVLKTLKYVLCSQDVVEGQAHEETVKTETVQNEQVAEVATTQDQQVVEVATTQDEQVNEGGNE